MRRLTSISFPAKSRSHSKPNAKSDKVILGWRSQTYSPLIARRRIHPFETLAITKTTLGRESLKEATKAAGKRH